MNVDFKGNITQLIPQKSPFVMIGEMLNYGENTIKVLFQPTEENIFCVDGFFVESGMIEHMAQSVALHTGYTYYLKNLEAPTGYIGSIKSLTLDRKIKLGDVIETEVEILQEFAGVTLVEIVSRVNNEVVAQGQMKTVIAKE